MIVSVAVKVVGSGVVGSAVGNVVESVVRGVKWGVEITYKHTLGYHYRQADPLPPPSPHTPLLQ